MKKKSCENCGKKAIKINIVTTTLGAEKKTEKHYFCKDHCNPALSTICKVGILRAQEQGFFDDLDM